MKKVEREDIRIWRNEPTDGIEYRRGVAVAEPYPKHWHDEYQLCLITDGGGELHYRGNRHNTPATSLFIVHPGEVHSNNTESGCSFRSIYIEPAVVERISSEFTRSPQASPFFRDCIVFDDRVVSAYISLHLVSESSSSTLEREFHLRSFLIGLMTTQAYSGIEPRKVGRESSVVHRVREYISENYERNISLDELEQLTGFSTFHLNRVFSKTIGVPPHAFQTQVRISAAKKLIRLGHSLAEAAATVGFADQSHLHRHFRRLMKVTPGEYLKASKNVQY